MAGQAFCWQRLPAAVLQAMLISLGYAGHDAAVRLRRIYGDAPDVEVVRTHWPQLRDDWLAHHPPALAAVTAQLWQRRRQPGPPLGDPATQLAFLRRLANSASLRTTVLAHLLAAGRPAHDAEPAASPPPERSRPHREPATAAQAGGSRPGRPAEPLGLTALDRPGATRCAE